MLASEHAVGQLQHVHGALLVDDVELHGGVEDLLRHFPREGDK